MPLNKSFEPLSSISLLIHFLSIRFLGRLSLKGQKILWCPFQKPPKLPSDKRFTNLDSIKSSPLCPGIFVEQGPQRNIQRGQVGTIE